MAKRLFYLSLDYHYQLKENLEQIGLFEENNLGLSLVLKCEDLLNYIDSNTNSLQVLRDRVISFGNRVVPSIIKFCILDNFNITLHLIFKLPQTVHSTIAESPALIRNKKGRPKRQRENEYISNALIDRFSEMQNRFTNVVGENNNDDDDDEDETTRDETALGMLSSSTASTMGRNTLESLAVGASTACTANEEQLNLASIDLSELDYRVDFLFSENTTVQFCLLVNLLNQSNIYIDKNELQKIFPT